MRGHARSGIEVIRPGPLESLATKASVVGDERIFFGVGRAGLSNDSGAGGIVALEDPESISPQAEAYVLDGDLENSLRISGEVTPQPVVGRRSQQGGLIT